ncbi:MAG TPA: hypothetical protein VD978_12125 [Azospirillum sp.]|nr:hypothetical protein [Azospirillum sp.]
MSKRLYARGGDGVVAIVEGGSDAPISYPLTNLSAVHFHSSLSYLRVVQVLSFTASHAAYAAQELGGKNPVAVVGLYVTRHYCGSFDPSTGIPPVLILRNGGASPSTVPVQAVGPSTRSASFELLADGQIHLVETARTFINALPAMTTTWTIYVFGQPV